MELTGIVRGNVEATGDPRSGPADSAATGRLAGPGASARFNSFAPRVIASPEAVRSVDGGLLNSRPHQASPEMTTTKPSAGNSQTR